MENKHYKYFFMVFFMISRVYSIAQVCQNGENRLSLGSNSLCSSPFGIYKLVFEDNFQELNEDFWRSAFGVPRDLDFTWSKQWYSPNNVKVTNGKLYLVSNKDNITREYKRGVFTEFKYTSGEINTKFEVGYGKYEIKCKLPGNGSLGFFPSFWGYSDFSGEWHEIDIFEFFRDDQTEERLQEVYFYNKPTFTMHSENSQSKHVQCAVDKRIGDQFDAVGEFHTYAVEYLPDRLTWYIDDTKVHERFRFNITATGQPNTCGSNFQGIVTEDMAFPQGTMNLKITSAIHFGDFAPPPENTGFPANYIVEHVKIWQYVPCFGQITISNQSDLDALLHSTGNYLNAIYADQVSISNVIIGPNKFLKLYSSNPIELENVDVEAGAFLEASIVNNFCTTSALSTKNKEFEVFDGNEHIKNETLIQQKDSFSWHDPSQIESNYKFVVYNIKGQKIYEYQEFGFFEDLKKNISKKLCRNAGHGVYFLNVFMNDSNANIRQKILILNTCE